MSSEKQAGYPQQGYNQSQGYGYSLQSSAVTAQPHDQPDMVVQPLTSRPSDYLILSLASCFFCWPMAICALMFSLNSRKSADSGDYMAAQSQGRTARNISIAAIVIGSISIIIAVVGIAYSQYAYSQYAYSSQYG